MNRKQEKYFEERLAEITRVKRGALHAEPPDPAAVTHARKVIRDWEAQRGRIYKLGTDTLQRANNMVRRAILFGTADDAERALAALERMKL